MLVIIKSSEIMNAKSSLTILANLKTIHPFIEIPALPFTKDTVVNGNMLVAANMLATKMVMGRVLKLRAMKNFLVNWLILKLFLNIKMVKLFKKQCLAT